MEPRRGCLVESPLPPVLYRRLLWAPYRRRSPSQTVPAGTTSGRPRPLGGVGVCTWGGWTWTGGTGSSVGRRAYRAESIPLQVIRNPRRPDAPRLRASGTEGRTLSSTATGLLQIRLHPELDSAPCVLRSPPRWTSEVTLVPVPVVGVTGRGRTRGVGPSSILWLRTDLSPSTEFTRGTGHDLDREGDAPGTTPRPQAGCHSATEGGEGPL